MKRVFAAVLAVVAAVMAALTARRDDPPRWAPRPH